MTILFSHEIDLLSFNAHPWRGNIPILLTKANRSALIRWGLVNSFIEAQFIVTMIRIVIEGKLWNKKKSMVFSFVLSFIKSIAMLVILTSIKIHRISQHFLRGNLIAVAVIKIIGSPLPFTIKKITLSVGYESTSLVSLSYLLFFMRKNCKFLSAYVKP